MKRYWMLSLMLVAGLGFRAGPATANAIVPTLAVSPPAQGVALGDPVEAAITISGLGDSLAPSLSMFDLDIAFDSAVLAFSAVAFGDPILGDQLDLSGFGSITITDHLPGAGMVNIFELSFDLDLELDTQQAGSFTLATLTFDTLTLGVSALDISILALGDSLGFSVDASVVGGVVNVIPEPSAAILFGAGLLVVGRALRRRRSA